MKGELRKRTPASDFGHALAERLKNAPIRRKLLVISMVTASAALLLAGAGIVVSDSFLFRGYLERDLTALARITGLHVDTIRRGREELDARLADRPIDRVRRPGAGRPPVKKKTRPSSRT